MTRRRWTDELVIAEIKNMHTNGEPLSPSYVNRNHGGIYRQAFSRFGSWKNAVVLATGLDYKSLLACKQWTADIIISEINKRYENGASLTAGVIVAEDKRLHDAACSRLGSWRNAIELAGYEYDDILAEGCARRVASCSKYSDEYIINFIREQDKRGGRLSSSYMRKHFNRIIKSAEGKFGSWKAAIERAGLDYGEICEDAAVNQAGRVFEGIVGEILEQLQIPFVKYEHEKWRPDFILGNNCWIDAKLSEWTSTIPETIEKYEPHCDSLTIVFLRGNKTLNKKLTEKTSIVSINYFIDQLPQERRRHFHTLLAEMERNLNGNRQKKSA